MGNLKYLPKELLILILKDCERVICVFLGQCFETMILDLSLFMDCPDKRQKELIHSLMALIDFLLVFAIRSGHPQKNR